jgi:hypothetical protein
MAPWFVLAVVAVLAWSRVADAQSALSTPPRGSLPQGPGLAPSAPVPPAPAASAANRKAECALLPGGKAPVAAIANLPTPLSPRSLDLVYFGKRLADLTAADFQRIAELSKRCGPGESILAQDKVQKLSDVVRESQKAREATIAWGKERIAEVEAMPAGRQRLMRLNDLWIELESHESDMVRADVDGFAVWIAQQQQAIYDAAPRWRPNRPAIVVMPIAGVSGGGTAMASGDRPILSGGHARRPGGEEE